MSIKTAKENICVNKIIGQKEESFIVEGVEIVPDIKPDILNVISSNGVVCIYKKEIMDGKVKLDGSVYVYTLYVADDENASIKCINSSLDFSKTFDMSNIKSDMQLENTCKIENIDCKMLNGRKFSLRASIKSKTTVYFNEDIEVIKDIEDVLDIQRLNKNYNINSLLGTGSTKAYAKDTVKIDNIDNLEDIVKVEFSIINKETKVSYNKLLVKADSNIKILYLTDDNRLNTVSATIPVMGFIDMQNVTEENLCETSYELKNIQVKPNNIEDHSIYVEAEVEICCSVYESRHLDLIEDLYSPSRSLEFKQQNINIMQNKKTIRQICNIRKQEIIDEIGSNKICDVDVKPTIVTCQVLNGRIGYEGEVSLNFLYINSSENRVLSKNVIEPFSFNLVDDTIKSNTQIETFLNVLTQEFIVMPDSSIDMKVDLEFEINASLMEGVSIINEINEVENRCEDKYSIVIYYTKAGDTLWNIAKRFKSTIDDIVKANKIDNPDLIMPGEQLFIPRAV